MAKSIPWGNEEIPRSVSAPEPAKRGGYSAFSAGPLVDPTPHELYQPIMNSNPDDLTVDSHSRIPTAEFQGPFDVSTDSIPSAPNGITDKFQMSPYGGPYGESSEEVESPAMDESNFKKLEHKLAHKKGVTNPAGLAAKIGREKLGEKEMERRSEVGREHHKE